MYVSCHCRLTGVVYDERMMDHKNEMSSHPECPKRISSIWKELVKEGIVECCKRISARDATEEEILLVHRYNNDKLIDRQIIVRWTDRHTDNTDE